MNGNKSDHSVTYVKESYSKIKFQGVKWLKQKKQKLNHMNNLKWWEVLILYKYMKMESLNNI